jgi:hypothetical protein
MPFYGLISEMHCIDFEVLSFLKAGYQFQCPHFLVYNLDLSDNA